MTKYELFKKITDELTPLILNLEKDINNALSKQSIARKPVDIKKGLSNLARSIFTKESNENILDLYFSRRKNLNNYIKLENKLNELYENLIYDIKENIITENASQVQSILSNFKQNFVSAIKNIANELQVDYDKEKEEYMKKLSTDAPPDDISDSEIEKSHKKAQEIDETLEEFMKLPYRHKTQLDQLDSLMQLYMVVEYAPMRYKELPDLLKKIIDENKYEKVISMFDADTISYVKSAVDKNAKEIV
jgi:hypothetical protein